MKRTTIVSAFVAVVLLVTGMQLKAAARLRLESTVGVRAGSMIFTDDTCALMPEHARVVAKARLARIEHETLIRKLKIAVGREIFPYLFQNGKITPAGRALHLYMRSTRKSTNVQPQRFISKL